LNGKPVGKRKKVPIYYSMPINPVDWYPWGLEAFQKAAKETAYLSIHRIFYLPLVSCNGAWVISGSRDSKPDEQYFHFNKSRSWGTPWYRHALHVGLSDDDRQWRMASDHYNDSGKRAVLLPVRIYPARPDSGRQGMLELIPVSRRSGNAKGWSHGFRGSDYGSLQNAASREPGEELDEASTCILPMNSLKTGLMRNMGDLAKHQNSRRRITFFFYCVIGNRTSNGEALAMVEENPSSDAVRRCFWSDRVWFSPIFHRPAVADPATSKKCFTTRLY